MMTDTESFMRYKIIFWVNDLTKFSKLGNLYVLVSHRFCYMFKNIILFGLLIEDFFKSTK